MRASVTRQCTRHHHLYQRCPIFLFFIVSSCFREDVAEAGDIAVQRCRRGTARGLPRSRNDGAAPTLGEACQNRLLSDALGTAERSTAEPILAVAERVVGPHAEKFYADVDVAHLLHGMPTVARLPVAIGGFVGGDPLPGPQPRVPFLHTGPEEALDAFALVQQKRGGQGRRSLRVCPARGMFCRVSANAPVRIPLRR